MVQLNIWCALAATLCASFVPAQDGKQEPAPAKTEKQAPPAKLSDWPALPQPQVDKVMATVAQFHKPNPDLYGPARDQLVEVGAAAAPLLFQRTSDKADGADLNAQLFQVFDRMLGPEHAALIARELKKPRVELNRYLTARLCRFVDRDMLPVFKAQRTNKDPETAFYAELGLLALQQKDAVPAVIAYTKANWDKVGATTAAVLPAARGNATGSAVFEAIANAPVPDQMAGLRLCRYVATKEHGMIFRTYLQSSNHQVKKEAINALRVIHDEEPIETLSVFQAIEMAKTWLTKV